MGLGTLDFLPLEATFDGKCLRQADHDGEGTITIDFSQLNDLCIRHFSDEDT